MPKSKVRKKNDFTVSTVSRTPVKVKSGPSSVWFVAFFCGSAAHRVGVVDGLPVGCHGHGRPGRSELDGAARPVELRDRFRFHDQRIIAHHALALVICAPCAVHHGPAPSLGRQAAQAQSHACDSSPLWITPVDNASAMVESASAGSRGQAEWAPRTAGIASCGVAGAVLAVLERSRDHRSAGPGAGRDCRDSVCWCSPASRGGLGRGWR